MKNEKLYHAITDIREELIQDAERHRFRAKKVTAKRILTIAASLVLAVGLGYMGALIFIFGPAQSGGTANDNRSYMAYQGPVFPLTTLEADTSLTAERHLTYDFTAIVNDYTFPDALVTDIYTLTNPSSEDKTYHLAYPFVASINTSAEYIPTVSGIESADVSLHVGKYTGGYSGVWGRNDENGTVNLDTIHSWEGYKALLSDGTYRKDAFEAFPEMNQSVIVYEIANMQVHGEGASPTLQFSCEHDPKSVTSFALGTRGGSYDMENGKFSYRFGARDEDESVYIFVVGGDLTTYSMQGYEDGGCDKNEEIEITAAVTRTEGILGEVLYALLFADRDGSVISNEIAFGAFAEMMYENGFLAEDPAERYRIDLSSLLADARNVDRVMYLTLDVTLSARESKTLTFSMQKAPSMDFAGKYTNRSGFDMVTALGSSIAFTEQRASIVIDTEKQEILAQNFGFDPQNGVATVILSLETEHYWMDLRTKPHDEE